MEKFYRENKALAEYVCHLVFDRIACRDRRGGVACRRHPVFVAWIAAKTGPRDDPSGFFPDLRLLGQPAPPCGDDTYGGGGFGIHGHYLCFQLSDAGLAPA